jgi:hypothetical protein
MQHIPRCDVSHGVAARRVAPVQLVRRIAVTPPRRPHRPRAAPLPPRARRCADGHHRRKLEYCRDCVGDKPEHGDDNVWSDRRLEHSSGVKHGERALPNGCARRMGYRKADVQRRHQQMERCERIQHVPGTDSDYAAYKFSYASSSLSAHIRGYT